MVKGVLLVINRSAATGYSHAFIKRLSSALSNTLHNDSSNSIELQVEVVDDHAQAKDKTKAFLASINVPALVIAGGGGGTLRAIIEGICEGSKPGNLPGPDRVRIASLRIGSGNVVAKQFGMPTDPVAGLKEVVANLYADRTVPCCIMRCEIGLKDSSSKICYAATMAGFGQFGRGPGDLARWHRRVTKLRKLISRKVGIEKLNDMEYGLSLLIRSSWCALCPNAAEILEVRMGNRTESMRLLAGVVMNFQFKTLPFEPGIGIEDPALSLNFVPYPGRFASIFLVLSPRRLVKKALQIRIEDSELVEIRLKDRDTAEFFLDEDPMIFYGRVLIQVAGMLAFVPGLDYRQQGERKREEY